MRDADTVLVTVPNQLGVEFNARILESIVKDIVPALDWRLGPLAPDRRTPRRASRSCRARSGRSGSGAPRLGALELLVLATLHVLFGGRMRRGTR